VLGQRHVVLVDADRDAELGARLLREPHMIEMCVREHDRFDVARAMA